MYLDISFMLKRVYMKTALQLQSQAFQNYKMPELRLPAIHNHDNTIINYTITYYFFPVCTSFSTQDRMHSFSRQLFNNCFALIIHFVIPYLIYCTLFKLSFECRIVNFFMDLSIAIITRIIIYFISIN